MGSCADYACHGKRVEECDDVAKCATDLVATTLVVRVSIWQAIPNALSFVTYSEMVSCVMIVSLYMSFYKGCCWFRDVALLRDLSRVTTEASSYVELEAQRRGD